MESSDRDELLRTIGRRLRRARMNQRLTQAELAQRSGLRQATISHIERGEDHAVSSLLAILDGLGRRDTILDLLPDDLASPIDLAARRGEERQRVRRPTTPPEEWVWGDER